MKRASLRAQAIKDRQQQEKVDEIDLNHIRRVLDQFALADRRGGQRGTLAFWHQIRTYAEEQVSATTSAIRRAYGDERRGP